MLRTFSRPSTSVLRSPFSVLPFPCPFVSLSSCPCPGFVLFRFGFQLSTRVLFRAVRKRSREPRTRGQKRMRKDEDEATRSKPKPQMLHKKRRRMRKTPQSDREGAIPIERERVRAEKRDGRKKGQGCLKLPWLRSQEKHKNKNPTNHPNKKIKQNYKGTEIVQRFLKF